MNQQPDEEIHKGDFPGGPVVKTSPSNTGGEGSIPGGELRSHMVRGQKIKQKQYCNKFNKDFKNGPLKKKTLKKKKRERDTQYKFPNRGASVLMEFWDPGQLQGDPTSPF